MTSKPQSLLGKFLVWRVKHISHRQFVLLLSIVIGFLAGIAAVVIKNSVHFIQELLIHDSIKEYKSYLYFAYPLIGIAVAVVFIKYVIRNRVGHGIPTVLHTISKRNGIMKRYQMFASVITSAFTVGFGGSVGLEGPTVSTGSALGSNIAQAMHLNYKTRILLIGCAAAGAMASIFKAPIAAIVFAIEVFMLDLTLFSLVPLLLASVSAAVTSLFFLGDDVLFHFSLKDAFQLSDIPFYMLLGVVAAIFSVYFTKVYFFIAKFFDRIKNTFNKLLIGGLLLGLLLYLFPPLYGEGYELINSLLEGKAEQVLEHTMFESLNSQFLGVAVFFLAVLLLKIVATSITFGAGGIGGIFAPTLFMGSTMGFLVAKVVNGLGIGKLSESNFTLVGMAGLMAGVLHAPLTAIFLIAELTGGYELFIPLMITSAISFALVKYFLPHSVYTMQLAKRGELLTHNKDQAILTLLKLDSVIENDFMPVKPNMNLGEMVKVVSSCKRNLFPVLNKDNELKGVITLDDIREIMFTPQLYEEVLVKNIMHNPPEVIFYEETMDVVMEKFKGSGAWNLPVIRDGRYVGFVSKSKLFSVYRRKLIEFSGD